MTRGIEGDPIAIARTAQRPVAAPSERRRHERLRLHRLCTLITRDARLQGWIEDVSLGGLRVQLPLPVESYRLAPVTGVDIPDLGPLTGPGASDPFYPPSAHAGSQTPQAWVAVERRWSSGPQIGLRFTTPHRARPVAEALIALAERGGPIQR
ncbi:PilZ domain-containing protein [Maritimibacter alkaliphilus]|uniref:PilZ domain-containing protein n=1 Tax=Maritimibacter alkaliphilus TaxID=404236 RepID=UPI001C954F17|nr:PilZ domain-containing protein [Maritimibacter alkaliphilus]MBY6090124.1 PilZ domain-containing protein [Maritimibacter alkaliphilus]